MTNDLIDLLTKKLVNFFSLAHISKTNVGGTL